MKYDFEELKERFKPIEDRWEDIRAEYDNIAENFYNWPKTYINNGDTWTMFPIFDRITKSIVDRRSSGSIEKDFHPFVPITKSLIEEHIPNHGAATFSRMLPGAILNPHRGYHTDHLRYHLGIDVPEGNCGLRCGAKIYRWKNRESFVFDDRELHNAWNKTKKRRTILMIDFIP